MPKINYRTKDGKRCRGVTTILGVMAKPALLYWSYQQGLANYNRITEMISKECDMNYNALELRDSILKIIQDFQVGSLYEQRDKAADGGTLAHAFVEHDLRNLPEPNTIGLPKDVIEKGEACYLSFLDWKKVHNFKLIHSELPLISEKYKFGGCLDIGAVVNEMGIIDIKTSKDIYFSMWVQVAAYGQLYNENYPDNPIRGYHILRLGTEGDFDHKFKVSLEDEWDVFLNLLNIQNQLDKRGFKL